MGLSSVPVLSQTLGSALQKWHVDFTALMALT
ncbi:hypothetical protein L914_16266 [Phytophthora nicotianae]|uniref:Uncharacterized protein n=1 Tax=Phytophthora nicotianae TaxID=4792 RepID=W2MNC0_PHYNI|nr:hypothetical protein L914_16266 [Phytophthora nicotianae]